MYHLSDEQIDFILDDLRQQGIQIEDLRQNLLDHVCILIEQNLEEDGDFEKYYSSVISSFYRQEMREIEEETIFLLTHKTPFAVLSRNQFFAVLFTVFIGPFAGYALIASINSSQVAAGGYLPVEVWRAAMVFSLHPLLILIVLFLTPERFEPLIPRGSKVLLGINPFIRIIPPENPVIPWQIGKY